MANVVVAIYRLRPIQSFHYQRKGVSVTAITGKQSQYFQSQAKPEQQELSPSKIVVF